MGLHLYFSRNSQELNFEDWIPLLTLSLAPLVVHLISGVPSPTFLHTSRPRWHDSIVLFNPSSIVWRYFAITDLRIRCKNWDAFQMAASSSLFWTANGWDGSLQMLQKSRDYYTSSGSSRTRVKLMSFSTANTLVVTLQGVQALYSVIGSYVGEGGQLLGEAMALDVLFFPLAILSLLRLPAAFWLSDEIEYRNEDRANHKSKKSVSDPTHQSLEKPIPVTYVVEVTEVAEFEPADIYHPPPSWRGVLVRSFWVIMALSLWLVTISSMIPFGLPFGADYSQGLTQFLMSLFYLLLMSVSVPTMVILAAWKPSSTVLPCINCWWYKIYTIILFVSMFVVFMVAVLETRKTPCGRFTSLPAAYDGAPGLCPSSSYVSVVAKDVLSGGQIQIQPVDLRLSRESVDGWCEFHSEILPKFEWK